MTYCNIPIYRYIDRAMTHVSRRPMKKKVAERVHQNLLRAVLSGRSARRQAVLSALLTRTEKVMIAKRLAVVIMLENGLTYYRIGKTLKVSTSTSKRLHRKLLAGSFRAIRHMIGTDDNSDVIAFLEKLLQFRMPPIAGPGRWKFLREN